MAHLDDLDLNAHLDGEADHGAHLEVCVPCQSRLSALHAVAVAVGAPVPALDGSAADGLVARALAAETGRLAPSEADRTVVQLAGRTGRGRAPAWLAAAAVAMLALAAVPVVLRATKDNAGNASAVKVAEPEGGTTLSSGEVSKDAAGGAELRLGATAGSAVSEGGGQPVSGGDLGEQSDPAAVGTRVRDRLEGRTAEAPTAASPVVHCETQARQTSPELGALAYVAALRWRGVQAEALVFRVPGNDTIYQLEIMAQQDCRRLAQAQI